MRLAGANPPWHPRLRERQTRSEPLAPRHDVVLAAVPSRHSPQLSGLELHQGMGDTRGTPGPASILVNLRAQMGLAGSEVPCGVMGRREGTCTPAVGRGHPACTLLRSAARMGEDRPHGTCPPKGHQSPPQCTHPAQSPASCSPSQTCIPLPIPVASPSPPQPSMPTPAPSPSALIPSAQSG